MSAAQHIVNISGGKDSAATAMLAIERGVPFRAVNADTDHEHPLTYEWTHGPLADLLRRHGVELEVVRADFTRQIETRRENLRALWTASEVPENRIEAVLEVLQPTGIAFLDLCMLRGVFPSTRARFCTEELKVLPMERQVFKPALARGPVVKWQGERAEESPSRALLPKLQRVRWPAPKGSNRPGRVMAIWRPILDWTAEDVFALHRRHGIEPNPLYKLGMGRVGCMPCIMAGKAELAQIAARFPEHIERVAEWERRVAQVSKRGLATFFAADKTPRGARLAREIRERAEREISAERPEVNDPKVLKALVGRRVTELARFVDWPKIGEVAEWARTDRGGQQWNMLDEADRHASCSSIYGLCE